MTEINSKLENSLNLKILSLVAHAHKSFGSLRVASSKSDSYEHTCARILRIEKPFKFLSPYMMIVVVFSGKGAKCPLTMISWHFGLQ